MKRIALLYSLAAACAPSQGDLDAAAGCDVVLAGNLAETVSGTAACPTLAPGVGATEGDTLLHFALPSRELGGDFQIDLDLGRMPTPGVYRSETTELWTAMGVRTLPSQGACLFVAGNNATPSGYFVLEIGAIDEITAHGDLSLTMFVLPRTADDGSQTDCGTGSTEDIQIQF